jgi:hypothetical protein
VRWRLRWEQRSPACRTPPAAKLVVTVLSQRLELIGATYPAALHELRPDKSLKVPVSEACDLRISQPRYYRPGACSSPEGQRRQFVLPVPE